MGLFTPEDRSYDESVRMTGFNRYKQLISFHAGHWTLINMITTVGALPMAAGMTYAVLTSSSAVMLVSGLIGGAIFGPFFAGLHDALQRGFRDAPDHWWTNYKKSWKQNWRSSLIPGSLLGLALGMLIFMAYILLERQNGITFGTAALYSFSALVLTAVNTLYWAQMVLFDQSFLDRMRNILLFSSKYLWSVLWASVMQIGWLLLMVLFAPITLVIVPFIGFWYILFVAELKLYDKLNEELHIEELYYPDRVNTVEDDDECED